LCLHFLTENKWIILSCSAISITSLFIFILQTRAWTYRYFTTGPGYHILAKINLAWSTCIHNTVLHDIQTRDIKEPSDIYLILDRGFFGVSLQRAQINVSKSGNSSQSVFIHCPLLTSHLNNTLITHLGYIRTALFLYFLSKKVHHCPLPVLSNHQRLMVYARYQKTQASLIH
jgi:hypothetical protein